MSKKNLFLVLNPFQLICAIEARSEFGDNANNILIILDREAKQHIAYRQISNLIDLNWHRVIRLNEPKNRGIWRNVLLFKNLIKMLINQKIVVVIMMNMEIIKKASTSNNYKTMVTLL
mgnify:CR=1 FL=1